MAKDASILTWLWKLLFILVLGPILLFPARFPEWVVLVALGLLLVPWIVRGVRRRRLFPATPINFLLLPFLLILLPLSLWVSPLFWEASWPKATSLLWSVAVFFAVVDAVPRELTAVQRQSRLRILILIYMAAGVAMTAVGLLAMESVSSRLPTSIVVGGLLPFLGQSINPNEIGGIVTLYLPLVVAGWAGTWAFPKQRSLRRFVLWLALALFFAGVLLLTASFGALMGVFAGCGLVLLLLNRRARLMLLPIGVLTFLGVIVVRVSPLLDQAIRIRWNNSIITRLAIWSQALHSTQDFPVLGTGLGTFRYVAPVLYPLREGVHDVGHAHNLFWQAALDFGLVGGLLFVLMWVIIVAYLIRSLRDVGKTEADLAIRVMAVGLLGSLIAHALYSLFDALAPGARPGFVLWYLFGLIVAVGAAVVPRYAKAKWWRLATVTVFLLLSVAVVRMFWPVQYASSVTALALLEKPQVNETAAALAAQTADENCRLNWHIGRLAHERNDWEARDAAWQKLLACSPQHIQLMQTIVLADPELADPERTDPYLAAAAIAGQPDDAEGYFWRASQVVEDDIEAAIALYEQGLALTPNDGLRWVELGKLRETNGDNEGAIEAFNRGCVLVDRGKNGCPRAAKLYMAAGEYELAAARYRTSMQQLPSWLPAQRGLADALLAMGRGAEAVPYLTNLAENGDNKAQEQLQELTRDEQ